MALLNSEANYREAFYRTVGTTSSDDALTENGEATNEVCDTLLSFGLRAAQQFLVAHGMWWRWVKRTSAIAWSGTEAADGGLYVALPSDFLRLSGDRHRSSLVEANGERWGQEIEPEFRDRKGQFYYLLNGRLYRTRSSTPPTTIYLEYVFLHPEFTSGVTLDFPEEAAGLAIAYAAEAALAESWYAGDEERSIAIRASVPVWERQAMRVARRSRKPRRATAPRVVGTHYFAG